MFIRSAVGSYPQSGEDLIPHLATGDFDAAGSAEVSPSKVDAFVAALSSRSLSVDLLLYLPGSLEKLYPGALHRLQTYGSMTYLGIPYWNICSSSMIPAFFKALAYKIRTEWLS